MFWIKIFSDFIYRIKIKKLVGYFKIKNRLNRINIPIKCLSVKNIRNKTFSFQ
jgi:hypothetical protein